MNTQETEEVVTVTNSAGQPTEIVVTKLRLYLGLGSYPIDGYTNYPNRATPDQPDQPTVVEGRK